MSEDLSGFIEFVTALFPCINPYTSEKAKTALIDYAEHNSRAKEERPSFSCFRSAPFGFLAQGDIFDSIPFEYVNENGEEVTARFKALLISNTCDADHDENLTFAPFFNISIFGQKRFADIKLNTNFKLLCFPDSGFDDYVADLSKLKSFPKSIVIDALENDKLHKLYSLNTFGYYLFLTKLTVHLMRPEDNGVNADRNL